MTTKLDLSELFGKQIRQDDRQFHKQIVNVHEFYLSGDIESPEEYIQWFDTIRHAGEHDVIKIYINSRGGDVFTAIQFIRILQDTPATVIISVEGFCASGATMLLMAGDSFEISDYTVFMFHNYSSGTFGKGGEMFDELNHMRGWSEKLLRGIYKDFLTETEINSLLDNKDIWMDGEEVANRLKLRLEKMETAEKLHEEMNNNSTKETTNKKSVKPPKER